VPYNSSAMVRQKPSLIIKISSCLSTAVFDCRIYGNLQTKIYLMSAVKLNLMKFHGGTGTQTSQLAPTCISHIIVGQHLPERYTQTKCALIMHMILKN